MQLLQQSESQADRRRVFINLVSSSDGFTPVTGETGTVRLTQNGGVDAPSTNSLVEVDSVDQPGRYYVELTQTELGSLGVLGYSYNNTGVAQFHGEAQVVPWNPYDSVRMGLTALPNAAAESVGGLYTRGTGAGQINQTTAGRIDTDVIGFSASALTATAIATDAVEKIADGVLSRPISNAEAASFRSLAGAVAKLVNKIDTVGNVLRIYKTDDVTIWGSQAVSTNAAAEPITGLDTN